MANTPIQFVDDSVDTAIADAIADYQSLTGRTLHNADPEMLEINAFAYRLALVRKQINTTGNQNLIAFATGAALDQLGQKSGTFRLKESPAVVTIEFNISGGAPTLVIPAGTRVKSNDGAVLFATDVDTNVPSGTTDVDIDCTCLTPGVIGNGYTAGLITVIVDPIAYVAAASNTDTSAGGADAETDDQLRARIPLANATYSVAGPSDAYIYFAKTASPSIVDVAVTTAPVAGGIQTSTLNAGGTGYVVNDEFTVNGGTVLAKGKITAVSVGVVTAYELFIKGSAYSTGTAINTTAVSGSGTGFKINITAIVSLMTVTLYPLLAGGALPNSALLDDVMAACSDQKVRPLNDTVVALAPTAVNYSLAVNLTVKKGFNRSALQAQVLANLRAFVNQWDHALGVDLKLNQYRGQCMIPGVYDVAIPSFTVDVAIADNQFGNCTSVAVAIVGVVDEP